MEKWECQVCGYIYELKSGVPGIDTLSGTPGEQTWKCPKCGISKEFFEALTTGPENKHERQEPTQC
ncbi:MAG: rubredoxin [Caldiserica bacterium]|nr:rubredoxin [Caldisericota bacterium]